MTSSLATPAALPVLGPAELRAYVLYRPTGVAFFILSALWIGGLTAAVRRLERRHAKDHSFRRHTPHKGTASTAKLGLEVCEHER